MNPIVIPPMPSITALAYELAHKAMLEGWDIKIDMNKGTVTHEIHCKPNILPHSVEPTTQVLEAE